MAEAEFQAILLVIIGGAYFFLVLPLVWFRLHRVVRGRGLALFLGAVAAWFLAHFLLAFGSPWAGGLLVLSAAAMGVAILGLAGQYARLVDTPAEGKLGAPPLSPGSHGQRPPEGAPPPGGSPPTPPPSTGPPPPPPSE